MQYKVKAEITVFLSLLFGIMSALIITVIESAGEQATRIELERIMQTAIHSCFSEYNQELLNKYDIFAIDCSYRKDKGSVENINNHIRGYAERNINNKELRSGSDFLTIVIEETGLKKYELLSDDNGSPLKNQINEYMRGGGNLSGKSTLLRCKNLMTSRDDGGFMDRFAECLGQSGGMENNPAEKIYEIAASSNLLLYIVNEGYDYKSVPGDRPSARPLNSGTYIRNRQSDEEEDYLLNAYINEKFSDILCDSDYGVMVGEKEYIISGKSREKACIEECAEWILNQRKKKNIASMMSNEDVLIKTEELAYELCSECEGDPYYVRMSLIYAWAYVESLAELNHICSRGGSLDLSSGVLKPVVPLYDLINFEYYFGKCPDSGMDYSTILIGMLMNTDTNVKLKRCMDIMEINMIKNGHKGFRIDGCVTAFAAEMITDSKYGHGLSIEREFGY